MAHTFTFRVMYDYDTTASGITLPVILSVGHLNEKTLAKVDTGASFCIFKRQHGEALGLDIESGSREEIATATGSFFAYGHEVSLSALECQIDVTVYFASSRDFNRNVLGRQGWLRHIRLGIVDYDGKLYASGYDDET